MPDTMKSIHLSSSGRGTRTLHVEADGCIVNIQVGLHDADGNRVTHISVNASGNRYAGDPEWWVAKGSKVDPSGVGLRVVEKKPRTSRKRSSRRS